MENNGNAESKRYDSENSAQDIVEYSGSKLCNPSHNFHRYFFLIFVCSLGIGNYFVYDTPGALQEQIQKDMDVNTETFAWLYSLYSWPNVILSFFGGYLIDRYFGIEFGSVIFCCFTFTGHLTFGFGALIGKFWLMETGRFIFGIGGESIVVASSLRAVKWYKGKELNMVFGLNLSIIRIGSTLTFNVMEPLYNSIDKTKHGHVCLGIVLIISSGMVLLDLLNACLLGWRDKRAIRILNMKNDTGADKISIRDVASFKANFWLMCLIIVFYYAAIFPFVALGLPFWKRKFNFGSTQANAINSIVYFISGGVSPFLGILIGRTGRDITWVLISSITTYCAHGLLAFTEINPWIGMCIMGIGYSILACTVWPMVSFILPEHQLGTAYGIIQSVQNLGLAIVPIAAGRIVDTKGYFPLEMLFLALISVSNIFIMALFVIDENTGGVLNMTPAQRTKEEEKKQLLKDSTTTLNKDVDHLGIDGSFRVNETNK